jgi:4-carboxymuconolactone decarboxylase
MRWFVLLAVLPCAVAAYFATAQSAAAAPQASSQASARTLPPDIDPESLNRLPKVRREDLDDLGKKLYDAVGGDNRLLGLDGPTGIRMHSPRVSEYMTMGNQYLRFGAGIEPRLMELAILVVARETDSQFEWTAHEPPALNAGLEQRIIDIVKHRRPLTELGEKEAAIIQLGREALGRRKVEPETFARARKLFGRQGVVNIVSLMSHYAATAMLLTTFDQQLRPGQQPLLPLP